MQNPAVETFKTPKRRSLRVTAALAATVLSLAIAPSTATAIRPAGCADAQSQESALQAAIALEGRDCLDETIHSPAPGAPGVSPANCPVTASSCTTAGALATWSGYGHQCGGLLGLGQPLDGALHCWSYDGTGGHFLMPPSLYLGGRGELQGQAFNTVWAARGTCDIAPGVSFCDTRIGGDDWVGEPMPRCILVRAETHPAVGGPSATLAMDDCYPPSVGLP